MGAFFTIFTCVEIPSRLKRKTTEKPHRYPGEHGDFLFQFHMMTMFSKDKMTGYAYICVITVITIR